jgi:type IV secretion system protein TrbE
MSFVSAAPNGYFVDDLIVSGPMHQGGYASRGFVCELPDQLNASNGRLNNFHDRVSRLLSTLTPDIRMQIQWYCDSDYSDELNRYAEETRQSSDGWAKRVREERFQRYTGMMERRELRRERLAIYFSIRIDDKRPKGVSAKEVWAQYSATLEKLKTRFLDIEITLRQFLSPEGGKVRPMTQEDLFLHLIKFLNPSTNARQAESLIQTLDPELSIQENCWLAQGRAGQKMSEFQFYQDGYYHNLIALSRWPESTWPGIIDRLTRLGFLDYQITVNIQPLDVSKEIRKEEHQFQRIEGDFLAERKRSLLTAMTRKDQKIRNLAEGFTFPYHVNFIIRVWNKTVEGLSSATNSIKSGINSMQGAQYQEIALPSTARKLYYDTWPGFPWRKNTGWFLYAENHYLADMLPLSSTFVGHLGSAEAIYDGPYGNLIGIKTFSVTADQTSPQHAVLFGMSGCGKSAYMCDLLSQTDPYFDFTCIVEEGLSYGIYTQVMGFQPIIVQPDGGLTVNYLDTQGLPLTSLQLATSTALLTRMIGVSRDEDKQALRTAQIAQYVNQLYEDMFNDWSRRNPDLLPVIARHACAVEQFRTQRMAPGATPLEAFADLRDWRLTDPDEAEAFVEKIDEGVVARFSKDPETSRHVRNLAFAYFRPEDHPQHSMLKDLMMLGTFDDHDRQSVLQMATMLAPWCSDGNYGKLFDGVNNVNLTGRICHFELGYIPEALGDMKAVAAFLICNHTRQHIITLPRGLWKRNIYEEVGRLLNVPGGEKIVSESYAQMRKFNAWNISIIQQYAGFKNSPIRPTIMGNTKQFFFMKQMDRSDLEDINLDVGLPEVTINTIQKYPLPEQLTGKKYSALTYYHTDVDQPVCGTAHNIASKEMLYCSASSGSNFDTRGRAMRKYKTVLEGIIAEVNGENQANREANEQANA